MTSEEVAIALGWRPKMVTPTHKQWVRGNERMDYWPPAYTISLDAIMGEITRLKLDVFLANSLNLELENQWKATIGKHRSNYKHAEAPTAPLALCLALMAYLKESANEM